MSRLDSPSGLYLLDREHETGVVAEIVYDNHADLLLCRPT